MASLAVKSEHKVKCNWLLVQIDNSTQLDKLEVLTPVFAQGMASLATTITVCKNVNEY